MTDLITKVLSPAQYDRLEKFAGRINKFNANLAIFDADGNCLLYSAAGDFNSDLEQLAEFSTTTFKTKPARVKQFGPDGEVIAICLKADRKTIAVAVIDYGDLTSADNEDLRRFSDQFNIDYELLEKAAGSLRRDADFLAEMLNAFADEFRTVSKAAKHLEMVSTELTQAYEEVMLLHNMSKNMKVTHTNATFLQMACDQIIRSVNVEGIAIYLKKHVEGQRPLVLTAGCGMNLIDVGAADILHGRLESELGRGREGLLDSAVGSTMKYDWPRGVRSIIAVPLWGNDGMIGLMVATNSVDKPDFDAIDVKLFNSVANQCAVFIENDRLFGDLKELFIGSLKALINSIDAKDQYTRGHSERVAFISRWIGERLAEQQPLEDEQIHRIYLAGLLHDIGKIGVDEDVLRKKGKLTEEDMNRIKAHPRIGAAILADIKQMTELIPGIMYHHERIDGKGYPEGLKGDQIPFMGKIIGLADAFDAMTSRRVYRDAMSIKRATAEIEKNLGTQFDEHIARVFIQSDIKKLWNIIQDGFIESWDYSNFSEYGTTAVGTLIR